MGSGGTPGVAGRPPVPSPPPQGQTPIPLSCPQGLAVAPGVSSCVTCPLQDMGVWVRGSSAPNSHPVGKQAG